MKKIIGTVYFLVNTKMPGLLKIGYTNTSVNNRLSQLNSTGIPVPFELGACFLVNKPSECEKQIHTKLRPYRLSDKREFFEISLKKAIELSFEIITELLIDSLDIGRIELENHSDESDNLSKKEVSILIYLTEFTSGGYLTRTIQDHFYSSDNLDIEYYLASLKSKGFVVEKYDNYHKDKIWRITSEGVKHLYDNEIIKLNS